MTHDDMKYGISLTDPTDFGYLLSSTVEKLSILLFYRRLASPQVAPKFNHAVSACMILSIGVWIGFSASLIATCSPVNAFWHRVNPAWREHHHFSCFNQGANILGASVIAIPMDLTLAILPITLFSKLKMDTTRKAALGALFATCFLPTVAVIVRTIYLYRAFYLDWDFTCKIRSILSCLIFANFHGRGCTFQSAVPKVSPRDR